jgi:hypothetical protein
VWRLSEVFDYRLPMDLFVQDHDLRYYVQ